MAVDSESGLPAYVQYCVSGMHSRSHRQGKIPDGVFHLAQDYLYELKTISAASSRYGHASGASAVDKRANKITSLFSSWRSTGQSGSSSAWARPR